MTFDTDVLSRREEPPLTRKDVERLLSEAGSSEYLDLTRANLTNANLSLLILQGANLRGAYLSGADLRGADLRGADLREAYLIEANLRGAILREAYLIEANLIGADLRGADLRGADLSGANLTEAILTEAILTEAYLIEANLRGAILDATWLDGTRLTKTQKDLFKKSPGVQGLQKVKIVDASKASYSAEASPTTSPQPAPSVRFHYALLGLMLPLLLAGSIPILLFVAPWAIFCVAALLIGFAISYGWIARHSSQRVTVEIRLQDDPAEEPT